MDEPIVGDGDDNDEYAKRNPFKDRIPLLYKLAEFLWVFLYAGGFIAIEGFVENTPFGDSLRAGLVYAVPHVLALPQAMLSIGDNGPASINMLVCIATVFIDAQGVLHAGLHTPLDNWAGGLAMGINCYGLTISTAVLVWYSYTLARMWGLRVRIYSRKRTNRKR